MYELTRMSFLVWKHDIRDYSVNISTHRLYRRSRDAGKTCCFASVTARYQSAGYRWSHSQSVKQAIVRKLVNSHTVLWWNALNIFLNYMTFMEPEISEAAHKLRFFQLYSGLPAWCLFLQCVGFFSSKGFVWRWKWLLHLSEGDISSAEDTSVVKSSMVHNKTSHGQTKKVQTVCSSCYSY